LSSRFAPPARGGLKPPYSRVSFYAGGDALIRVLTSGKEAAADDIEGLYRRICELH
jgi:hypothetical protein